MLLFKGTTRIRLGWSVTSKPGFPMGNKRKTVLIVEIYVYLFRFFSRVYIPEYLKHKSLRSKYTFNDFYNCLGKAKSTANLDNKDKIHRL